MKIALLFGLFPKEIAKEILENSIGPAQLAADTLQWAYVNGFESRTKSIEIINLPFIGSYPKRYKQIKFETNRVHRTEKGLEYLCTPFINIVGYKFLSRYCRVRKKLFENYRETKEKTVIIVYSLNTPFLKAVTELKKTNPDIEICVIVPDLPEFMSDNKSKLYNIFKNIDRRIIMKLLNRIDYYVLLSKYMTERLPMENKRFVVVEGIYTHLEEPVEKQIRGDESLKVIFYAGTLAKRYGIMNLVNAFSSIGNQNYRLIICGSGDAEEEVINFAKDDPRIIYKGQIDRNEVLKLQKQADLLVNPRTPEGAYTKYSFPSKTIEYLASGVPVLLYKLPGIPEEYYDFCFTIEELGVKALASKIDEILQLPEEKLNHISKEAKSFILMNKNPEIQCTKVLKMIKN